jgi:hypothetical protein
MAILTLPMRTLARHGRRVLVLVVAPIALTTVHPTVAHGDPPVVQNQLCTPVTVAPSLTRKMDAANGPSVDEQRSSTSGYAGLNCTKLWVVDYDNQVSQTPPPSMPWWSLYFHVVGEWGTLPKTEAACKALSLDSQVWAQSGGTWTKAWDIHQNGDWRTGGSKGHYCAPPHADYAFPVVPPGATSKGPATHADHYRVAAASSSGQVLIRREISAPLGLVAVKKVPVTGGSPRPGPGINYIGEPFQVDVVGNTLNGNATTPNMCSYTITMERLHKKKSKVQKHVKGFVWQLMATPTDPGDYRISVEATKGDPFPQCSGASHMTVRFHDSSLPWLTDIKLEGSGMHFIYGENNNMPEHICSNCSDFSPPHNIGLLKITPTFMNARQACSYAIEQRFEDDVRVDYPAYPAQGPLFNPWVDHGNGYDPDTDESKMTPFLNRWSNSKNVVTVTARGEPGVPGQPPCNINAADERITKTITFTDDDKLPPVTK